MEENKTRNIDNLQKGVTFKKTGSFSMNVFLEKVRMFHGVILN